MRSRKLSANQIVYLLLVVLSALIGAYSGYRWDPEDHDGRSVAMTAGHSWFGDVGQGLVTQVSCTFGVAIKF